MNNQAPAQTKKTKKPNFFVRFLKRIMKRFVLAVWKMEDEIAEGEFGRNNAPSDSDAEPKRDYSYRSAQMIDGNIFIYYNRVDWYINRTKGVIFEPGSMRINVPDGVSAYAAYKENNCKFSLAGTSSFSIPTGRYVVSFRAMKSEGVSCKLHIMAYDNGRKVELLRLSANAIMPLEVPEKYKNFRLALQCSGSGSMVIESIEFSRQTFAAASTEHTDLSEIRISPAEDLWFYPSGSPTSRRPRTNGSSMRMQKMYFSPIRSRISNFQRLPISHFPCNPTATESASAVRSTARWSPHYVSSLMSTAKNSSCGRSRSMKRNTSCSHGIIDTA